MVLPLLSRVNGDFGDWRLFEDRGEQDEKLAHCPDLLYNPKLEDLAGVAEWVDAVDLKSKIALLEKLLQELKRKIQ